MEVDEEIGSKPEREVCRLCDDVAPKMYSIFDKNEEGRQVLQLIKNCLPIIVYRTDPFSKQVCEKCYDSLNVLSNFRNKSLSVAEKHQQNLTINGKSEDRSVQLFYACRDACQEPGDSNVNENDMFEGFADAATSTDDLTIQCSNCKTASLDPSTLSELELCTDLHQAIADSLKKSKLGECDSEKLLRNRRKRPTAFYNELEDSLCSSSLTEYTNNTNTGSSHYLEFPSDDESYESSETPTRSAKRRKLDDFEKIDEKIESEKIDSDEVMNVIIPEVPENYGIKFEDELEYRYFPLSLLQLTLNAINKNNLSEYEPDEFYRMRIEPKCSYCNEEFRNCKILALHEVGHINIELGDKVDNPIMWHESRDDSDIRNKWLNSCDDNDTMNEVEEEVFNGLSLDDTGEANESLLIPIGTDDLNEHGDEKVEWVNGTAMVNGIALADYTKEERKSFYHSIKIGTHNKKFCHHCRYTFKDNWAIESHYFSSACYYTCRYCGMRFNKQRQKFDEHVQEHLKNGDQLSTKLYAPKKMSSLGKPITVSRMSVTPKPEITTSQIRVKRVETSPVNVRAPVTRLKTMAQQQAEQGFMDIKIKDEPGVHYNDHSNDHLPNYYRPATRNSTQPQQPVETSQSKTGSQAYFCRKCYKVFFKLDEFNIHNKNCEVQPGVFPAVNAKPPAQRYQRNSPNVNGEAMPRTKNTPKEVHHNDSILREHLSPSHSSPQSYICLICNTPFPTIYSRNSHMRIHKGETGMVAQNHQTRFKPNNVNMMNNPMNRDPPNRSFQHPPPIQHVQVKQEPLEPEVEIFEPEPTFTSIGAVSITPISKNPRQKPTINPNIMKIVQNNPHLTIKGGVNSFGNANNPPTLDRYNSPSSSHMPNQQLQSILDDKSYKCSNCWENFNNKSHLYFHKKNQCEGSKFPCPFCKKRFGTEAAYSSHIYYSHPE